MLKQSIASVVSAALLVAGPGHMTLTASAQAPSRSAATEVTMTPAIGASLNSPIPTASSLNRLSLTPSALTSSPLAAPSAVVSALTFIPTAVKPALATPLLPAAAKGAPLAVIESRDPAVGVREKAAALNEMFENPVRSGAEALEVLGRSAASAGTGLDFSAGILPVQIYFPRPIPLEYRKRLIKALMTHRGDVIKFLDSSFNHQPVMVAFSVRSVREKSGRSVALVNPAYYLVAVGLKMTPRYRHLGSVTIGTYLKTGGISLEVSPRFVLSSRSVSGRIPQTVQDEITRDTNLILVASSAEELTVEGRAKDIQRYARKLRISRVQNPETSQAAKPVGVVNPGTMFATAARTRPGGLGPGFRRAAMARPTAHGKKNAGFFLPDTAYLLLGIAGAIAALVVVLPLIDSLLLPELALATGAFIGGAMVVGFLISTLQEAGIVTEYSGQTPKYGRRAEAAGRTAIFASFFTLAMSYASFLANSALVRWLGVDLIGRLLPAWAVGAWPIWLGVAAVGSLILLAVSGRASVPWSSTPSEEKGGTYGG